MNPFRWPLYVRVLIGVGLGLVFGVIFEDRPFGELLLGNASVLGGLANADLGELSKLLIRLLKALATPLVLFAILDAFVRIGISGRAGGRLAFVCLVNVSVAMTIGLAAMNLVQPGRAWRGQLDVLSSATAGARGGGPAPPKQVTRQEVLASYVPESIVAPLAENSILTIVLLGILGGAALRRVRSRRLAAGQGGLETVERLIDAGYQITMQMLVWVVELVPFAVFGAVAHIVGREGLEVFHKLWVFLAAMLAGLAAHSLVYYPLSAWLVGGKSPSWFLSSAADAVFTGLSTNSSLATVPVTLRCLTEKLRVSDASARLSACVGTNFNNDGITLYEAMAALFLAQAVGLDLGLGQQAAVVLAAILATLGIAGIPEAGLIILPLVLPAAGLSDAQVAMAMGLIMPVDWIIARCRSAVNVLGDMQVAILLDRGAGNHLSPDEGSGQGPAEARDSNTEAPNTWAGVEPAPQQVAD